MWQVYDRNVGMSLKRKEPKKNKQVHLSWYSYAGMESVAGTTIMRSQV